MSAVSMSSAFAPRGLTSEPNPSVSFVIVTWNARDMIAHCLDSVAADAPGVEVILIDNNSSDGTLDFVAASYPNVQVIRNLSNEGFGHACNAGASRARGEFLFFLNPDARMEPGCVRTMLDVMRASPETIIAGPLIRDDRRRPASAGQRFLTQGSFCKQRILGRKDVTVPTDISAVDWVSGAALMIRRQSFESLRGFDERFWMYVEDMYLCWQAHQRGWAVTLVPQATVTHNHATSARNNVEQTLRSNAASTLLWFRETNGTRSASMTKLLICASLLAVGTKHCLVAKSVRRLAIYLRICWLVMTAPHLLAEWQNGETR